MWLSNPVRVRNETSNRKSGRIAKQVCLRKGPFYGNSQHRKIFFFFFIPGFSFTAWFHKCLLRQNAQWVRQKIQQSRAIGSGFYWDQSQNIFLVICTLIKLLTSDTLVLICMIFLWSREVPLYHAHLTGRQTEARRLSDLPSGTGKEGVESTTPLLAAICSKMEIVTQVTWSPCI